MSFGFRKCFPSSGGCQVLDWYINDSISYPVLRTSQSSRRGQTRVLITTQAETAYWHGWEHFGSGVGLWSSFRGESLGIRPWKMDRGEGVKDRLGPRIQASWAQFPPASQRVIESSWIFFVFIQQIFIRPGWSQALRHNGDFNPISAFKWPGSNGVTAKTQVMVLDCSEGTVLSRSLLGAGERHSTRIV